MNSIIINGNLGREPEITMTKTGKKVCKFSLANNDINKEEPEWNRFEAWENKAEYLEKYCHKGYRLIVQGKLRTRTYTTQNGEKATTSYVLCDRIEIERSTENDTRRTTTQPREERSQNGSDWLKEVTIDAEDLPF